MELSISSQSILNEYLKWMENNRNSARETLRRYNDLLILFLNWLNTDSIPEKLSALLPETVQTFFLDYAKDHGRSTRRSMQSALRTFFRFCLNQSYIMHNLAEAVPTIRTHKLSNLPRGIEDKDAKRVLSSIDRSTNLGKRDYAIIQMLYTYGVRGGQICTLCLKDINWEQNEIWFPALKHGKESLLPLTDNVGESLLDYLQHSRPTVSYNEIFLTIKAPYIPFRSSRMVSKIVRHRMNDADIKSQALGAHVFRHCFASRILKQGHSLKSIADMLGHRCISSTFIYTKVDFRVLNQVPLEWPKEES